jgi:co-chaperonin GroES (HSP10)
MSAYDPVKIDKFEPLHDYVIVANMNFDEKISHGGIIIPCTDGKLEGIHPRWGRVYAVGPDQQDVSVGQYVCVKHGRWTRGADIEDSTGEYTIRRIDPADILLVSNEPMQDESIGNGL